MLFSLLSVVICIRCFGSGVTTSRRMRIVQRVNHVTLELALRLGLQLLLELGLAFCPHFTRGGAAHSLST